MSHTYMIIGSGAAGLAAAETLRQSDPPAKVVLISSDPHGYYSRPGLAYYLAHEIPRENLFPTQAAGLRQLGITYLRTEVSAIDSERHLLQTKSGQWLPYDRLLIATGASAQRPDLPGMDLPEVVTLDSLADADHILARARAGKHAVVVGGGITALELVEGLHARGMHVTYLLRGQHYWNAVLDETESQIVERRLQQAGIKIMRETQLQELIFRPGRLRGVRIQRNKNTMDLRCDLLAIAIGIRPRVELAKAAGLRVERGILVDEYLRTSQADIFAAGDVAQIYDPISREYGLNSLWAPAIEQGRAAALNMCGRETRYQKKVPFNVTRLAGLITTIIGQIGTRPLEPGQPLGDSDLPGIMRGDSELWRLPPDAQVAQADQGDNRLRLYLRGDFMTGALLMGDQTLSRPIQHFIRDGINLGPVRPLLLKPGAPLKDLLLACWQNYLAGAHG